MKYLVCTIDEHNNRIENLYDTKSSIIPPTG